MRVSYCIKDEVYRYRPNDPVTGFPNRLREDLYLWTAKTGIKVQVGDYYDMDKNQVIIYLDFKNDEEGSYWLIMMGHNDLYREYEYSVKMRSSLPN